MTKDEFIEKFRSQFDETEPETINFDTRFKEIDEWNSMMALVIIAMADEEFHIRLTGDDIRSSSTVGDLFNVVNSKV